MIDRHDVTITIGGKSYTLSGIESETYLKEVAAYLNDKLRGFSDDSAYWKLSADMRGVMLQLNIADDFFKERDRVQQLEIDLSSLRAQSEEELAGRRAAHEQELEQLKESFIDEVKQMRDRLSGAEREVENLRSSNQQLTKEMEEVKLAKTRAEQERDQALQERDQALQEKEQAMQAGQNGSLTGQSLTHMDESTYEDQMLAIYDKLEEWQRELQGAQKTISRISDDMRRV